jgi:hypothetical protein
MPIGVNDGDYVKLLYLLCLVKGIWEEKPRDWPSSVDFVDPNNNAKSGTGKGSKPKKKVLIPMLKHLVKKYKVMAV